MGEGFVSLRGIRKSFDGQVAVDGISLDIQEGEFFTLLGPSGCGKTTTLRIIAGLEEPEEGELFLENRPLSVASRGIQIPPEKRNMGLVPQSYAVWPHLTVFENVAYPLKLRRLSSEVIRKEVSRALELVGLASLESRPGPLLSGGQQQRVALARALVYSPAVLLMDEPLSNLDAKLRDQMREELRQLQEKTKITVIFVTHDQTEAMSLSGRIAVMNSGKIEQIGGPQEVYDQPGTPFVRDFLGANLSLHGRLIRIEDSGDLCVEIPSADSSRYVIASGKGCRATQAGIGSEVCVSIRPENVALVSPGDADHTNLLEGVVEGLLFVGDRYECRVKIGMDSVLIYASRATKFAVGERVALRLAKEGVTVWPN